MRKKIILSLFALIVLMSFSGIVEGQATDDKAIVSEISSRIQAMSVDPSNPALYVNNVTVKSHDGDVILSGYVANGAAKKQIIDIAKSTPGVKSVKSNLKIYR